MSHTDHYKTAYCNVWSLTSVWTSTIRQINTVLDAMMGTSDVKQIVICIKKKDARRSSNCVYADKGIADMQEVAKIINRTLKNRSVVNWYITKVMNVKNVQLQSSSTNELPFRYVVAVVDRYILYRILQIFDDMARNVKERFTCFRAWNSKPMLIQA